MQKLISMLFLAMIAVSGVAFASDTTASDSAQSMSQEDATAKCNDAAKNSGLQGDELNAYVESCLQQSATMSSGDYEPKGE